MRVELYIFGVFQPALRSKALRYLHITGGFSKDEHSWLAGQFQAKNHF